MGGDAVEEACGSAQVREFLECMVEYVAIVEKETAERESAPEARKSDALDGLQEFVTYFVGRKQLCEVDPGFRNQDLPRHLARVLRLLNEKEWGTSDEVAMLLNCTWIVGRVDAHKKQFSEGTTVNDIVSLMKRHDDSPSVQEHACGALLNLAVHNESKLHMISIQTVPLVISAMRRFKGHHGLLEKACGAIWNLCDNLIRMMRAGEDVASVMAASHLVHFRWRSTHANTAEGRHAALDLGAISVVLDAIENNPSQSGLQFRALGALWNLSVAEASKKDLVADRVIELLVSVLRANTENVDLYKQTAGVFWNMSVVDEQNVKRRIGESGAIKLMMEMMERHKENLELLETATVMLWNCSVDDANEEMIVELGGIGLILDIVGIFSKKPKLLVNCMGVMWNLSAKPQHRTIIASQGGVGRVLECMRAYPNHEEVQRVACSTLWNLSVSDSVEGIIVEQKGIPVLLSVLRNCREAAVHHRALGALRNLAVRHIDEIIEKGGMDEMVRSLSAFPENSDVVFRAFHILNEMCNAYVFVKRIVNDHDGCEVSNNASDRNHHGGREAYVMKLACAGGIDALVPMVHQSTLSAEMQQDALSMLTSLFPAVDLMGTGQMLFPNSLLARLPKELVIEVVGHAAHLVQLDEIRHCLNETAFSTFLQLNLRSNEPLPEAAEQTDSE